MCILKCVISGVVSSMLTMRVMYNDVAYHLHITFVMLSHIIYISLLWFFIYEWIHHSCDVSSMRHIKSDVRIMSHIWMNTSLWLCLIWDCMRQRGWCINGGSYMNESCHTYKWCFTHEWVVSHVRFSDQFCYQRPKRGNVWNDRRTRSASHVVRMNASHEWQEYTIHESCRT